MSTDTTATRRRSPRAPRGADGRPLGKAGKATRELLLDSLLEQLKTEEWRQVSIAEVARGAGRSPAVFFTYFAGGLNEALTALCLKLIDEQIPFPPRLERIVHLRNAEVPKRARKLPDPIADRYDALAARVVDLEVELAKALASARSRRAQPQTLVKVPRSRAVGREQLAA